MVTLAAVLLAVSQPIQAVLPFGGGSGSVIEVDGQRYVLTCAHQTVDTLGPASVSWNGETLRRLRYSWADDLALYEAPADYDGPVLRVAGEGESPLPGDLVTLVGYADGRYRASSGTVLGYQQSSAPRIHNIIFDGGPGIPGESGGPVLTRDGKIAGVFWGYHTDSPDRRRATNAVVVCKFLSSVESQTTGACGPAGCPIPGPPITFDPSTTYVPRVMPESGQFDPSTPRQMGPAVQLQGESGRVAGVGQLDPTMKRYLEVGGESITRVQDRLTYAEQELQAIKAELERIRQMLAAIPPPMPSVDYGDEIAALTQRVMVLEDAKLRVIFEGGDEADEPPDSEQEIPLIGGLLTIPAQVSQSRYVNKDGETVKPTETDRAPLGYPIRNKWTFGEKVVKDGTEYVGPIAAPSSD